MSKQRNKATAPKEEAKPVVTPSPKPIEDAPQDHPRVEEQPKGEARPIVETPKVVDESIQSHSAQVTEGEAAQARVEGRDLKSEPLDPRDGAQLDQKTEAVPFDVSAEKKAAHAKPEEQPEPVKNAIVNPNGLGNEWPRG